MELLETIAQSHEIEKIINECNEYLIIITPYLQINNRLRPKLDYCFNRNTKTLILYRENKLTSFEMDWFDRYKNVTLMPIKNLHAKCYLNEKTALITSMNLYDYSQINNHEIGVKINAENSKKDFNQLLVFVNTILKTDYPQQSISYYINYTKEFTMGKLYAELTQEHEFPDKERGLDGVYVFMCNEAKKLHQFEEKDFKQDGTALLRTTALTEKLFNHLKVELIKSATKNEIATIEEKEYDFLDFNTEWKNYLITTFKNSDFKIEADVIVARDFPVKNVDYSNRYGFASFAFNFDYEYMRKVKNKKDFELSSSFKNYRLYWSPSNKINIYHAKNIKFKNSQENLKYCAEGLHKIIEEIKKFA